MSLKLSLKPNERLVIGTVVLRNGSRAGEIFVENDGQPILRESQILPLAEANTPCKQLYYAIQLLYLGDCDCDEVFRRFTQMAIDIQEAAPSLALRVADVSSLVLLERHYKALRQCRDLIEAEAQILACVTPGADCMTH